MDEVQVTGRDRIRAAFSHRESDRVPVFEQSVASDVASEILGRQAFTGTTYLHYQETVAWMQGEQAHQEFQERLERDVMDMSLALGFDMLHPPWRLTQRPTAQVGEYDFLYGDADGDHVIRRFDPTAKTFQVASRTWQNAPQSPDDLEPTVAQSEEYAEEFTVPDPAAAYPWQAEMLRDFGETHEVTGGCGLGIPLDPVWLMACVLRRDLVARYLDAQLRVTCTHLQAQAQLGLKVIWGGGDLAGKNGPIYGPRPFRELLLPRVKRLCEKCHQLGQVYVFRTDGNLWPIEREFFVESGTDGYGEIDYDAGMDLDRLKARHGDRITFWGNVPCGSILHRGSVQQVVDFTKHIIDVAAPGGGLIVGSSNSIVPGTPARNVVAMFETAREYGRY